MKPDLADVAHVAFRLFAKDNAGVPLVKHAGNTPVQKGKAWNQIGAHLKGQGKSGGKPNNDHTEMSIELVDCKTAYVIAFDPLVQTVFGPGGAPITLLPPSLSKDYLADVGLVYLDASGEPAFKAANDITDKYSDLPANAALIFTCDRAGLVQAWKDAFKGHAHPPQLAIPFYLNLYDSESKLPVWASKVPPHDHDESETANNFETHGGIHPAVKNSKPGITTHGGIHPSSNVQVLF